MEYLILKGVGGFYTVRDERGESCVCKARGRFRKQGITPVPGDRVKLAWENGGVWIEDILPRKNLLLRPAVANIDKLLIVMALSVPKPDLLLTDKLLLQCALCDVEPVLVLNKCDDQINTLCEDILREYTPAGYSTLCVSAQTGENLEALAAQMRGCICCFAGQSAVGKSSLLNALLPSLALETGELSLKTDRGRHTTRHAELIPAYGGLAADTPGFSLLDLADIEPEALSALYPEMRVYAPNCRFAACLHMSEPDCAVKEALSQGRISEGRYARYKLLLEELKEARKHKYD